MVDKKASKVVFVIPAFNEERIIFDTIKPIIEAGHKVICIDDASTDKTYDEASRAGATVIPHLINSGQGAALQTGFNFITQSINLLQDCSYVATFDADGQHSLKDLDKFLDAHREDPNLDIALGSRFIGVDFQGPTIKFVILKFMAYISKFTLGVKVTDRHNGYRVIKKEKISDFRLVGLGYEHADEFLHIISKNSLKYTEVPTYITYSQYSNSKGQPLSNGFKMIIDRFINGWQ